MNRNQTAITLARNGAVYLGRNQHKRQIGEWEHSQGPVILNVKYRAGTLGAKKNRTGYFHKQREMVRWFQQLVSEGQFDAD